MAKVRLEFMALDREELLVTCELLTGACFPLQATLDKCILEARWSVAESRAHSARQATYDAFDAWSAIVQRRGKLTAKHLAEEEKAKRRHSRLRAAEARAVKQERALWEQLSADWNHGGAAT